MRRASLSLLVAELKRTLREQGLTYALVAKRLKEKDVADLESIPLRVAEGGGVPVSIKDVATVQLGPAPRRGLAERGG